MNNLQIEDLKQRISKAHTRALAAMARVVRSETRIRRTNHRVGRSMVSLSRSDRIKRNPAWRTSPAGPNRPPTQPRS